METRDKIFRTICFVSGCCVLIAGIVMFIYFNKDYLTTATTEGRVVTCADITTSDGDKHQFVTAEYYVSGAVYSVQWENTGISLREMDAIKIHYNKDNPAETVTNEFEYISIFVIFFGALVTAFAIVMYRVDNPKVWAQIPKKQRRAAVQAIEMKKQIIQGIFQLAVGLIFTAFGVCVAIMDYQFWTWFFILFGLAFTVYMGIDFYTTYNQLLGGADIRKGDIHVEDMMTEEISVEDKKTKENDKK